MQALITDLFATTDRLTQQALINESSTKRTECINEHPQPLLSSIKQALAYTSGLMDESKHW